MGTVDVAGTATTQSLKVFKSNSTFQVILGKPWLHSVQAIHRYETDEITIQAQGHTMTIMNDDRPSTVQTMTNHNLEKTARSLTVTHNKEANESKSRKETPAHGRESHAKRWQATAEDI